MINFGIWFWCINQNVVFCSVILKESVTMIMLFSIWKDIVLIFDCMLTQLSLSKTWEVFQKHISMG